MCYNNINFVLQKKNVEFPTRDLHKDLYNILLYLNKSATSVICVFSGNKWHVKFALSFIILQEYTHLFITKWRPLQYQLDMCLWNTDAPAATESKYGKHT